MAGPNFNGTTPELTDIIRSIVDNVMTDTNVCAPAKIVKYDKDTQYADVEIQIFQKWGESLVKYPVIPNVPVKHPRARAGQAFVHMPLDPGDDVTLVFSHRSIDNWKTQGGMSDPDDPRKHHIADCYALIGGSAIPDAFSPTTSDSIEVVNGDAAFLVMPDGKFKIMNSGNELLDILDQFIDQVHTLSQTLSEDTVNTIFGPTKLNSFAEYATIATELEALKTKLETLKG